ncbi:ABC transporter permease [Methylosinus sp. H3A]|uniref:ABC transporter permease n=1 Tax=Methylosinus sp. H3A TaxID=2785786 RepID=UPI0018C29A62|nr:ABC transporter permease [Methylosinus sp. H3A]MBG0809983.1 ABC transporter permease [Methylosinus sp. H3A]
MTLTSIGAMKLLGRLSPFESERAWAWRFARGLFQKSVMIILFLLLWEAAPRLELVDPLFLPPFSEVCAHGYDLARSGKLLPHVLVSLGRSAGGFALGVVTAVPLGLLLGWHSPLRRYLDPLLQLLRQFNPIALLPVFILFFGVGYVTKVAIIYWVVVWPILLNTTSGVTYVDPILVKYGRSLSLTDRQIFTRIVIPSAVPSIFVGLRLAATYSLLMLVVSEEIGAASGLGFLVFNAQYLMGIHIVYVALLMLALFGFAANQALVLLERRFFGWKDTGVAG